MRIPRPWAGTFVSKISKHSKTMNSTFWQKMIEAFRQLAGNEGIIDRSYNKFLQHFAMPDSKYRFGYFEMPLAVARKLAYTTKQAYNVVTSSTCYRAFGIDYKSESLC